MLPFLKRKNEAGIAGIIVKNRQPDEKPDSEDKDDPSAGIHACAQALINAVHSKDAKGVSEALKDAFAILDSEPHEEGEHISPHSYDAQNQKAASGEND